MWAESRKLVREIRWRYVPRLCKQPRGPLSIIAPPSLPIYTNSHRRRGEMKWKKFLPVPKNHRRTLSEAGGEVGSIDDRGEAGPLTLLPTESTEDIGIGSSTLSTPTPLASRSHEINGTQMTLSWEIHLTAISCNIDPSTSTSDRGRPVPGKDENSQPELSSDHTTDPKAASENKPGWGSTAYATTKLAINITKESADAFPPLKSVLGGLSAILKHSDV